MMKTAAEWWDSFATDVGEDVVMHINAGGKFRALIECIQADAIEAAAEACERVAGTVLYVYPVTHGSRMAQACAKDIRTLKPPGPAPD